MTNDSLKLSQRITRHHDITWVISEIKELENTLEVEREINRNLANKNHDLTREMVKQLENDNDKRRKISEIYSDMNEINKRKPTKVLNEIEGK